MGWASAEVKQKLERVRLWCRLRSTAYRMYLNKNYLVSVLMKTWPGHLILIIYVRSSLLRYHFFDSYLYTHVRFSWISKGFIPRVHSSFYWLPICDVGIHSRHAKTCSSDNTARWITPSEHMFKELGWLSISKRIKYNKAVLRALNNLLQNTYQLYWNQYHKYIL